MPNQSLVNWAPSTFPNLLTSKDHARCKREIEYIIATGKAAFNARKTFLPENWDLNLREKIGEMLHLEHSLYGAEN
jgi:hypothetical protein